MDANERVGLIIAFEGENISDHDFLRLFSHLIETGLAWELQGFYGRTAMSLIEAGYIAGDGTILLEVKKEA